MASSTLAERESQGQVTPPPPTLSQEPKPKRDYAYATDRELADLRQQRDRLQARCDELEGNLHILQERLATVEAENARLATENRHLRDQLESERGERGFIGLVGAALAAVGGGLVSVWDGLPRCLFLALLVTGVGFIVYSSLKNLSAEVRTVGLRGVLRRLWHGRPQSGP